MSLAVRQARLWYRHVSVSRFAVTGSFHRCAGKETVNSMYGTRTAVLAGDFLFAQSSWGLAQLDNLEVWLPQHMAQHQCSCLGHIQDSILCILNIIHRFRLSSSSHKSLLTLPMAKSPRQLPCSTPPLPLMSILRSRSSRPHLSSHRHVVLAPFSLMLVKMSSRQCSTMASTLGLHFRYGPRLPTPCRPSGTWCPQPFILRAIVGLHPGFQL